MLLVYENRDKGISVEWKRAVHMPPHLHEAIEIVYVTNGNIAFGVGLELYDMNECDFCNRISKCNTSLSSLRRKKKQSCFSTH